MSNCNTHNCCFSGIDLVIKCYDPQPDFTDFTIPTWWFNRCNGKLFLLKEIDENGKAVWVEITGATASGIQEIIAQCGLVQPDSEGKIKVKGECGARFFADDCADCWIDILTEDPLTGGKRVYCGESATIGFRADMAGNVRSEGTAQIGDIPKYKEADSKVIVPSNINSVDGLTKVTRATKGEQKFLVEALDAEPGSDAGIEAKSTGIGYSYFQLTSDNTKWRDTVNPVNKNRTIFPIIDGTSKDPILTMLPNGVMLMPWQPKVGALFPTTAKLGQANVDLQIGSFAGAKFTTVLDQDGYNLSAGNFFPGDGTSQGAYYITNYDNAFYLVIAQFLANKPSPDPHVSANFRINYEGIAPYIYRKQMPATVSFETFLCITIIKSVKGKKITFSVASTYDQLEISQFGNTRENYLGIYMLG